MKPSSWALQTQLPKHDVVKSCALQEMANPSILGVPENGLVLGFFSDGEKIGLIQKVGFELVCSSRFGGTLEHVGGDLS